MQPSPGPNPAPAPPGSPSSQPRVTAYHWVVVVLACSGWLFDCMAQRIFVLGREPAFRELLGTGASDADVNFWGGLATSVLMVGWATGGILFGILSDRWGRVKVMVITLLAYTLFSALSGFARNGLEFLACRFLFGLGVGGMFGAATTLVAESVPAHFRTAALGSMQALSAFGNMAASGLSAVITPGQENYWGGFSGWQVLFFAGVLPIVLAPIMGLLLREPEPWRRTKEEAARTGKARKVGSMLDLFREPRWRKSTLVGICLGVSGMVGLWGIAFFSPELISTALKDRALRADEIKAQELISALTNPGNPAAVHISNRLPADVRSDLENRAVSPAAKAESLLSGLNQVLRSGSIHDPAAFESVSLGKATTNVVAAARNNPDAGQVAFANRLLLEHAFPGTIDSLQKTIDKTRSFGTLLQDVGSVLGMFTFTFVAARFSRRAAFLTAFAACLFSVSFVFYALKTQTQVYWMLPLIGFATLSVFAGYSIYFPELFPTRLRGTGVGFCYNTVRYLAAPFPFLLGWLSQHWPFRTVAIVMSGIYLLGMVALIWAPETKGQPLPED